MRVVPTCIAKADRRTNAPRDGAGLRRIDACSGKGSIGLYRWDVACLLVAPCLTCVSRTMTLLVVDTPIASAAKHRCFVFQVFRSGLASVHAAVGAIT